jgi:chemotaxis protein MotB
MASRRHRRGSHDEEEHENEERWLVSYADMMTLLFALFMVMFSISSVNISKFEDLQRSLKSAFSGQAVAGGKALLQTGSTSQTARAAAEPPLPSMTPKEALNAGKTSQGTKADQAAAAAKEQEEFKALKRRVDAAAAELHLSKVVVTQIRERGLVVRLLTDDVFFSSGSAQLKPESGPILHRVGEVIASEAAHPLVVEGYTDSNPIHSGQYPSNWELSGARASSVVREFVASGVNQTRLSLAGYAQQHPIASNATASGRSHNRRVEIVMTRLNSTP